MIAAISVMSLATVALVVFLVTRIGTDRNAGPADTAPTQTASGTASNVTGTPHATSSPIGTDTRDPEPGSAAPAEGAETTDTPAPTEPAATATPTPAITDDPNSPIRANATVNASELNVRTGAGTDHAKLSVDGKDVSLVRNNRVQIVEAVGDWFRIMVAVGDRAVEGYSYAPYITPDKDSGFKGVSAIAGALVKPGEQMLSPKDIRITTISSGNGGTTAIPPIPSPDPDTRTISRPDSGIMTHTTPTRTFPRTTRSSI